VWNANGLLVWDANRVLCSQVATISGGQALPRGAVLGQVTATGAYVLATASASDGSQDPCAILADYIDASAGDVQGGVYVAGLFNADRIKLDDSLSLANVASGLRQHRIVLQGQLPVAPAPTSTLIPVGAPTVITGNSGVVVV
jgi:hypothetical protein